MIATLRKVFGVPELKRRVGLTFLLLAACRIGVFIPVPGINGSLALSYFQQSMGGGQSLFQMVNIFSGGAFAQMTVTALGVVPYISASIIVQLLLIFLPSLQREIRENPEMGKRKIGRYTRLFTIFLALVQSFLFARFALKMNMMMPGIVVPAMLSGMLFGGPWIFYITTAVIMTTGTLILMWLGEQISDRGIGNGVSLIIALGILSSFPGVLASIIGKFNFLSDAPGEMSLISFLILITVFIFTLVATILIVEGVRKISVQHARRLVGRREIQGGGSYLPLKVNYAGVVPVIFASSLLMFPATLGQFLGPNSPFASLTRMLSPGSWFYASLYVFLIVFFTYFWTATQFHPEQIASDMKKNNAFIPGIKQGKATQSYLEYTMNRVTFIGAIFLAFIAVLPSILGKYLKVDSMVSYFLGGTAMLIIVGVVLDTMKQIDSFLLMKRYDGLMKKDRVKGR